MKKTFKLIDLDCANCASKMEIEISRINGVKSASISFMTSKLTIDADDERFDEIMKAAAEICRKVERNCKIDM